MLMLLTAVGYAHSNSIWVRSNHENKFPKHLRSVMDDRIVGFA